MFELFKALIGTNKETKSLLYEANDQFCEMLDMAGELLETSIAHLGDEEDDNELLQQARSIDKESNRMVRRIRKMLVEHLSFSTTDAPPSLVLMSVAKDGERIVDLCRDLLSMYSALPSALTDEMKTALTDTITRIAETRSAFGDNNEEQALVLVENEKKEIEVLSAIETNVMASGLSVAETVVACKALHCLGRIRSHLGNIASTVVFPIHRIDFVKRKFVEQAREEIAKH